MKILIIAQTFPLNPTDPTAHFMLDFATGFTKLGHEIIVLLPYHSQLRPRSFLGFRLITFKYIWPDFLHLLGFGNTLENDQNLKWYVYLLAPFYYLSGILAAYRLVKNEKINVISSHWILPNGFIASVCSKLMGIPLSITLAGSDVYISKQNFLFRFLAKIATRQARKIISNSPQLLKDLGVKGEVIQYPVPLNRELRTENRELTIATAGRPVEKKGFATLRKVYPDIEIISGLPIDQFRHRLLSVDIFIAYSIRDTRGNLDDSSLVVLEAMAAGCAVIATNLPGYQTIIKNQYNGLLVPIGNRKALSKAINLLRKNPHLRQTLGQSARATIKNHHTPEKIAAAYLDLFAKMQE